MRAGLKLKGDLTKPLKDIKIKWLESHWWSNRVITETLVQSKLNYSLKQNQLKTLMPDCELECSVINAYLCLLRDREERNKFEGQDNFFFKDPMFWKLAQLYCMKPHFQLESETKSMHKVFRSFRKQHEAANMYFFMFVAEAIGFYSYGN